MVMDRAGDAAVIRGAESRGARRSGESRVRGCSVGSGLLALAEAAAEALGLGAGVDDVR